MSYYKKKTSHAFFKRDWWKTLEKCWETFYIGISSTERGTAWALSYVPDAKNLNCHFFKSKTLLSFVSLHTFDKRFDSIFSVSSYWALLSATRIFHEPSLLKAEETQSSQTLLMHHVLPNHLGGPPLDSLRYINLPLFLVSPKLGPSWISQHSTPKAVSQLPRRAEESLSQTC